MIHTTPLEVNLARNNATVLRLEAQNVPVAHFWLTPTPWPEMYGVLPVARDVYWPQIDFLPDCLLRRRKR